MCELRQDSSSYVLLYYVLYALVVVYMYAAEDHHNHAEMRLNDEHVHLIGGCEWGIGPTF